MNTDQEIFAFKLFLDLHGKLPSGEKSECPDFIINQNDFKLGVELIELMESVSSPFPSAAKYSLEDKIAKSAQRQYDLLSNKKIMVNLQIVENLILSLNNIDNLASQISEIILKTIKDVPYVLSHNLEITENLPKGILNIYYDITPFLDESFFSVMRSKWLGSFSLDDLNKVIRKKEKNINSYRKNVDLIYMLIVEGLTFSSYLGPFVQKGNLINNSFDKIFLLKVMSRELIEIK